MPPCPFISNGFLRGIFDDKVINGIFGTSVVVQNDTKLLCRNSKLTVLQKTTVYFLGCSDEALMMIIEIL